MELTIELIAGKTLHITSQSIVSMYLEQDGVMIGASKGEDVFDYNGTLFPDAVVTATGRKTVHQYQPDLFAYRGMPGVPIQIQTLEHLTLCIVNTAILSQGELQTYYSLRVNVDGRSLPVSLLTTRVNWDKKGQFCIDLGYLCSLFEKQAIAI